MATIINKTKQNKKQKYRSSGLKHIVSQLRAYMFRRSLFVSSMGTQPKKDIYAWERWTDLQVLHKTLCNTLQHTATRCNTLQQTATFCNTM